MHQLNLELPVKVPKTAYAYGKRSSGATHGVVITKPHVVDLILDLAGYTASRNLAELHLLEPSCGNGAFLVRAIDRLLKSARLHGIPDGHLADCINAFDIDTNHVEASRQAVIKILQEHHFLHGTARTLATRWVRENDFLLTSTGRYDAVVGNPPYIRIEQISPQLQAIYRQRYASLYDRADLYVAFIERSLNLLNPDGILSFVCADRWARNRYGAPLRRLITERFKVRCYIDLNQSSPFESEVSAYPAIFAISPGKTTSVRVAHLSTASPEECISLAAALNGQKPASSSAPIHHHKSWFTGEEPWSLSPPDTLRVLRQLESRFQPLEADGQTKVRIGVATGCDSVYIVDSHTTADIEPDRLVSLVMRADLEDGGLKDSHRFVINTFDPSGNVIDLRKYPRLRRYFESRSPEIKERHVAQKNPASWYRTIDRVYPELVPVPKLLIPDIAGSNMIVLDKGRYHPHHNLYFVTSDSWDLEVLGGLLSSRVALFFIWSYAVKMRGGYLRFQAQYLRRIRTPSPPSLSLELKQEIKTTFRKRDFALLDTLALRAYALDELPAFDFVDNRK